MPTSDLIKKANAQIAEKQREIDELRQFISMCHKLQDASESLTPTNGHEVKLPMASAASVPVPEKKMTKTQVAIDIALEKHKLTGEPVPTRYILSEMEARGYGIKGNFPDSVLAGYLKSRKQLSSIRGKGWVPTVTP